MQDAKLYFSTAQAVTAATDTVSEYYLDVKKITEIGAGSQLFINVVVDSAYTYSKPDASAKWKIYLATHTGAPTSAHKISNIAFLEGKSGSSGSLSVLSTGLKCKVPLPSLNLKSHIGLVYQLGTGFASGTVTAYLSLT